MNHGSFLAVFLLLASVSYLANGDRWNQESQQPLTDWQVSLLAQDLPDELRTLYEQIIDPNVDEINKENYIWRSFELLKYRKYRRYSWFYYWLLDISGSDQQQLGRQTPKGQGGRTPPNIGGYTPGGRTPPNMGGHTPGGRTPPNLGGRTPGGRTPKRGGQRPRQRQRHGKGHGRNIV
ncbi:uncharacterized protein LOC117298579 [Asterias rubens]|uniref:uncharacterized protein LOC117298579 n=1 Tax=Asterias rubens TaxID=7604 RepID=UPI001455313D|nr:uncharacterized protein LOC117298579 [Asterias rubens]